jgi:hypothetical protein
MFQRGPLTSPPRIPPGTGGAGRSRADHHRGRAVWGGHHHGGRRARINRRRRDEHRGRDVPAGRMSVEDHRRRRGIHPHGGGLNHHHGGRGYHRFRGVNHAMFRRTGDGCPGHRPRHEAAQGPPSGVSTATVMSMSVSRTGLSRNRACHRHRRHYCKDSCFHVPRFRSAS